MKKFLILLVILFTSCTTPEGSKIEETQKNYKIKTIDNCQYIEFDYGIFDNRVYSLTHKGDCTNAVHVCGKTK
jgi:hypothetical protein